jgi:uncharacterized OB-fold protein
MEEPREQRDPNEPKRLFPVVTGWFLMSREQPRLIASRCRSCNTYWFPRETQACRNPACDGTSFENTLLGPHGKLWSFTDNRYKPPAPYVSPDPFVPYAIAAVELPEAKLVALGQVVAGVDTSQLKVGMDMELVVDVLFEDEENEYLIWKWKPAGS